MNLLKVLKGEVKNDLSELSIILSGTMIYLGKKAKSVEEGIKISNELINSGKAFDKFLEIVKNQNGDVQYLLKPEKYKKSKFSKEIKSKKNGYLSKIDNYQIGIAALELGAGRKTVKDKIDPKAGIIFNFKIGDKIYKDDVIAELFTDNKNSLKIAEEKIINALVFSETKVRKPKLIKRTIK